MIPDGKPPVKLTATTTVQQKVAELERRVADLEKRQRVNAVSTQTVQRVDLQPEMDGVWRSVDQLFKKVFGR